MKRIWTPMDLEALPVGSVILDLGIDGIEADAPAVACKAARGDWQVMDDKAERRYSSLDIAYGSKGNLLIVAYNPVDAVAEFSPLIPIRKESE